jgi:hypothetical protein
VLHGSIDRSPFYGLTLDSKLLQVADQHLQGVLHYCASNLHRPPMMPVANVVATLAHPATPPPHRFNPRSSKRTNQIHLDVSGSTIASTNPLQPAVIAARIIVDLSSEASGADHLPFAHKESRCLIRLISRR